MFAYRRRHTLCVARFFFGWVMSDLRLQNGVYLVRGRLFLRVAYVGSLLIERGIPREQLTCFFGWLISDLRLWNETYTVCSAFFGWFMSDLRLENEAYPVSRSLFLRVAYVGSSRIERMIPCEQRACFFGWLLSDPSLQNEAYTSMQGACFLRWFLSDLCITEMALNEGGTATPGKKI